MADASSGGFIPPTRAADILLFFGNRYYPGGGWSDYRGGYPTVDAAKEAFATWARGSYDDPADDQWAHIVENNVITWKWTYIYWHEHEDMTRRWYTVDELREAGGE